MQKGAWVSRVFAVGLALIVASVACSGGQPSPASDLADADAGLAPTASPQNCAVETRADGSLAQRVVVTTDRGKLVIENDESESADGKIAVEMVLHVEVGGQVFMDEKTTASSDKHARSHAVYGPLVQGVHDIDSWTDDGDTLHETVDGRAMKPVSVKDAKDNPSQVKYLFADGAPAPSANVDPQVQAAVAELFEKAHASSAACDKAQSPPLGGGLRVTDTVYQGNTGQLDDPLASGACVACRSGCVGAAIILAEAIPKRCSPNGLLGYRRVRRRYRGFGFDE